jgi:hypothetical protein
MKHSKESGDATSQKENLSLKCFGVHVENIDGDRVRPGLLEPSTSSRTREAVSNRKCEVTALLDQQTQSMIVLFLGVGILCRGCMIIPVSVLEYSKVASNCWQRRVLVR